MNCGYCLICSVVLLVVFFADPGNCQACGSVLTGSGTLKSANYPENYPPFYDCSWTIEAGDTDDVRLMFNDFGIEPAESCEFDYLEITALAETERFCGDKKSDVGNNGLLLLKGRVVLKMKSDDSVQLVGINMDYQVIPDPDPPAATTPAPTTTPAPPPTTTLPPGVTCDDEPCLNGADCTMDEGEVYCFCAEGFEGQYCETDINECDSNPCENGGTCVDGANSWSCDCVPGFIGETCGIDFDECRNSPCKNGATCEDKVNAFNCVCEVGWTNWDCDTEIDECDPNPCQNYGVCEDQVGSYTCVCHPSFTGTNCEMPVEEEEPPPEETPPPQTDPPPQESPPPVQSPPPATQSPPAQGGPPPQQEDAPPPENPPQQAGGPQPPVGPPPPQNPPQQGGTQPPGSPQSSPTNSNGVQSPPAEDQPPPPSNGQVRAPGDQEEPPLGPPPPNSPPQEESQPPASLPNTPLEEEAHNPPPSSNNSAGNQSEDRHDSHDHDDGPPVGAIVGAVLGGLAALAAVAGAIFYYLKFAASSLSKIHCDTSAAGLDASNPELGEKQRPPPANAPESQPLRKSPGVRKKKKLTKRRKDTRRPEARDLVVSSSIDSGITSRPTSHKDRPGTSLTGLATTTDTQDALASGRLMARERLEPIDPAAQDSLRKAKSEKKKRHKQKSRDKTQRVTSTDADKEVKAEKPKEKLKEVDIPKEAAFPKFGGSFLPVKSPTVLANPFARSDIQTVEPKKLFEPESTPLKKTFGLPKSDIVEDVSPSAKPQPASFSFQFQPQPFTPAPVKSLFALSSTPKAPEQVKRRKRKTAHRMLGPRAKTAATEFIQSQLSSEPRNFPNVPEPVDREVSRVKEKSENQPFHERARALPESTTGPIFFSQIASKTYGRKKSPDSPNRDVSPTYGKAFNQSGFPFGFKPQQHSFPQDSYSRGYSRSGNYPDSPHYAPPLSPTDHPSSGRRKTSSRHTSRRTSPGRGMTTSISSVDDLLDSRDPKSFEKVSYPVFTQAAPRPRSLAPLSHPYAPGNFPSNRAPPFQQQRWPPAQNDDQR